MIRFFIDYYFFKRIKIGRLHQAARLREQRTHTCQFCTYADQKHSIHIAQPDLRIRLASVPRSGGTGQCSNKQKRLAREAHAQLWERHQVPQQPLLQLWHLLVQSDALEERQHEHAASLVQQHLPEQAAPLSGGPPEAQQSAHDCGRGRDQAESVREHKLIDQAEAGHHHQHDLTRTKCQTKVWRQSIQEKLGILLQLLSQRERHIQVRQLGPISAEHQFCFYFCKQIYFSIYSNCFV